MIELYDSGRLTVKRDHTLAALGSTLLVIAGLMATYTAYLQVQLNSTQTRTQNLQAELAALDAPGRSASKGAPASPRAALVADLQRQAEQLERVAALARTPSGTNTSSPGDTSTADTAPTPAQWMDHLSALAQADTSLQKVDIERDGSARIEGLATSPQALNALVQAWEKEDGLAHLQPRSIDIKHEKSPAPFLRFQLRATPAPAKAQVPGPAPSRPAAPTTAPGAEAAQP